MSELSFSDTSNTKNEYFSSSNLSSIFFHFCFSIFSHPLYFSYFLFFSPYILRLLSFLSPLFITTTLLLLVALLTFTPNLLHQKGSSITSTSSSSELSESKLGFFLSLLQTFLAWMVSEADDKDEEIGLLDELEAYLVMFQASVFETLEPKSVEDCSEGEDFSEGFEEAEDEECSDEGREVFSPMEFFSPVEEPKVNMDESKEVKSLESLFQENAELEEDVSREKEEEDKEVNKTLDAESNKVEERKEQWSMRSGSKVMCNNRDMYVGNKVRSNSDREIAFGSPQSNWEYSGKAIGKNNQELCSNLGSFGSMRVEKEWRRTLACKLFEERHNADHGSEGMDMLWETYESESNKVLKKSNTKKGKKGEVEHIEDEDEEEEEEEIEEGAKLCCLQALKFSTGKMNLGMGRPNLLKFSKALKGIGWLHHVGKHGKKNNH